jgi:hypothetical protein
VRPCPDRQLRACGPHSSQSGESHTQTVPILHRTMDVTRSVASPSDDIKKAAVFEKDALLSAQTMIYVRGRRPCYVVDAT